MDPQAYLAEIKTALVASPAVDAIDVIEERVLPDRGYFRARLILSNQDFLEVAEYFVVEEGYCVTRRYRYQWMDETQQVLRKRWDNVEHFPDQSNFPHHVHVGEESRIEPGRLPGIIEVIEIIADEFAE